MRNRTYGGVRGRKTKVGEKLLRFPPTRFQYVKKRAIHKKMGAGSKKKGKITCLVFIFFLSLQQNKVFKKTIEPTIQGGLIQVNL